MNWFSPATQLPSPCRLAIGPGPGPRLIGLGAPSQWVPFNGGLACGEPEGLFVVYPHYVDWFPTPGPLIGMVPWSSEHLAIAFEQGGNSYWAVATPKRSTLPAPSMWSWLPISGRHLLAPKPNGTLCNEWLPDGAQGALKTPLWDRPGLAWIDQRTLYRGLPGKQITVSGSIPFEPTHIASGPRGSTFIWNDESSALAPPNGPPVLSNRAPYDGIIRFCTSGTRVWALDDEGRFEVSLRPEEAGDSTTRAPLGTEHHPWSLDVETSALHASSGDVVLPHLVPSAVAFDDLIIAGPGAAVWCRKSGLRFWGHPALYGDEIRIHDDVILVWLDDECRAFDRQGNLLGLSPLEPNEFEELEGAPTVLQEENGRWVLGDMGLAIWLPHSSKCD